MSKNRDHQLVFSLRKLSVGLASVAIATTFFAAGNVQTVHADALKSAEKQQISTVKQTESTDNTESVVGGVNKSANDTAAVAAPKEKAAAEVAKQSEEKPVAKQDVQTSSPKLTGDAKAETQSKTAAKTAVVAKEQAAADNATDAKAPISHTDPAKTGAKTAAGAVIQGAFDANLNMTVNAIVTIKLPDGTSQEVPVKLYRDATVDNVTDHVTWMVDPSSQVEFPDKAGYSVHVSGEITQKHGTITISHDNPFTSNYVTPTGKTIPADELNAKALNRVRAFRFGVYDPHNQQVSLRLIYAYRDATIDQVTGEVTYSEYKYPELSSSIDLKFESNDGQNLASYTLYGVQGQAAVVDLSTPNTYTVGGDKDYSVTSFSAALAGQYSWASTEPKSRTITFTDQPQTVTIYAQKNSSSSASAPTNSAAVASASHLSALTQTLAATGSSNDQTSGSTGTEGTSPYNLTFSDEDLDLTNTPWKIKNWPKIQLDAGYVPDKITLNVTYTAKPQSTNAIFQDADKGSSQIGSPVTLTGVTDQTIDPSTQLTIPDHYVLAEGQTIPNSYKFKAAGNQPIVIKLKQKIDDINDPSQLNKSLTRTITVNIPNKTPTVITQNTTFTRTGKKNEVTGATTYTDWVMSNNGFVAYDAPTVAGYTPTIRQVRKIENPTESMGPQSVVINYTANPQSTTAIFQDADKGNGQIGSPVTLTGVTDQTIDPSTHLTIPDHYVLADGQTIPSSYKFKAADNQPIVIKLKQKLDDITDPTKVTKTISRTITINEPGKAPQTITQTATFKRTGQHNEVTGDDTYTDWQLTDNKLTSVDVPEVAGYKPSQDTIDAVNNPTADTNLSNITVTYTADQAPVVPTESGKDHDDHHKPSDDESKDDQHKGNQSEEKHDTDKGGDQQSEQAKTAATSGTAKHDQSKQSEQAKAAATAGTVKKDQSKQSELAKAPATAGTAKSTQNKQAIKPADKRAQLPQTGTDEKSAAALALLGASLAVLGLGEAIVKKILH